MRKFSVLLAIACIIYACEKKDAIIDQPRTEVEQLKSFLKTQNSILANEGLIIDNVTANITARQNSGISEKASLDWGSTKKFTDANGEIFVVSYKFSSSQSRNGRLSFETGREELPMLQHLVFIKKDNKYSFFMRTRHFKDQKGKKDDAFIIEQYYDVTGRRYAGQVIVGKKDFKKEPLRSGSTSKTASMSEYCETHTWTSYFTTCTGTTMDNTVCTFRKKKHTYARCYYVGTPEEVQMPQDDPDTGGYWEEYHEETKYANQHIIDSLQGYPCAQDILKQLPNVNSEVAKLIDSVFGVSEDVNIIFKVDNTLNKDSLINGYAQVGFSSFSFFDAKVFLNPWVIQHSTKEYIAATLIHESIHAYIDREYGRYLTDPNKDSNAFKAKFPIFWEYKSLSQQELGQHMEMADKYVEKIKSFIRSFNPTISEEVLNPLAWKGLQFTTAWKARSDTNQLKAIGNLARQTSSDSSSYTHYKLTKCD